MAKPTDRPPEIEIIPPGAPDPRRSAESARVWVWSGDGRNARISVRPIGPLTIVLSFLALAGLIGAGIIVFLGLFLLWLPVLGAVIAAAIVLNMLHGHRHRLR